MKVTHMTFLILGDRLSLYGITNINISNKPELSSDVFRFHHDSTYVKVRIHVTRQVREKVFHSGSYRYAIDWSLRRCLISRRRVNQPVAPRQEDRGQDSRFFNQNEEERQRSNNLKKLFEKYTVEVQR